MKIAVVLLVLALVALVLYCRHTPPASTSKPSAGGTNNGTNAPPDGTPQKQI